MAITNDKELGIIWIKHPNKIEVMDLGLQQEPT